MLFLAQTQALCYSIDEHIEVKQCSIILVGYVHATSVDFTMLTISAA